MRVIYEISLEDMRGILAEKYEIDAAKIEFMGHGDLVFARIDVSETETPITTREYMDLFHPKKEAPAPETLTVNVTAPAEDIKRFIDKEAEEVKPVRYEDPDEAAEDRYKKITDGLLEDYIKQGYTIPAIAKIHGLEDDSKYSARLYKRAEKFRSEGASRGRRRHQEETQTTEQGADRPGLEVLPVPGMP